MADKMMRIAGRKPNGTAGAVSMDDNNRLFTNRLWKKEWVTISEGNEIRDTSAHDITAVDVRDVPIYSLRFLNRLSVPVTITFKVDVNLSNGYKLVDKDGHYLSLTIQPSQNYVIVTFNDFPELQYMQYLRMSVSAASAPESGSFSAYLVKMG